MHELVHTVFETVLSYTITGVEILGAVIIIFYVVRAFIFLLQRKRTAYRNSIATGITTGLSFLLASEVFNTIVAPDWNAIGQTCAVLLMRAGMTFLIHWENKMEEENGNENHE